MLSEINQAVKDKYHMISPLTGTLSTKQTSKQSIVKDTEVENRLTVTRGDREGNFRGIGWRVCRNNYKGHMDNNRGGGNRGGRWGGLGCWTGVGGKGRKLYSNNNKKRKEKNKYTY